MRSTRGIRAAMVGAASLAAFTLSAVTGTGPAGSSGAVTPPDRPLYAVLSHSGPHALMAPASSPPTWTFTYTYGGRGYHDTFLGAVPSGGTSTTIPVFIVPVEMTYGSVVTSPEQVLTDGRTVVEDTEASPIFQVRTYNQGGTNVGTTQYEDAFQRLSLWHVVSARPGYHLLLGQPTVEPLRKMTVPASKGSVRSAFGARVITAGVHWFDVKAEGILASLNLPHDAVTFFVTSRTYLAQSSNGVGGCCIGGYHSSIGTQVYGEFTYISTPGAFAQDVSALSHEVGEAIDDPYVDNVDLPTSCGAGAYEVGDPLEGDAHFGTYPYTLGAITYHLQDLVTPVYFGAPASTSLHGWTTFQGTHLTVCELGS